METGYIISLIILAVAIILFIIAAIVAMRKIKPTLNNAKETQEDIQDKMDHFTQETEVIQNKVDHITKRIESVQNETNQKLEGFDELSAHVSDLNESLNYLKVYGGENAKTIGQSTFEQLKTDGPIITETFKRAFKRTADKQKQKSNK